MTDFIPIPNWAREYNDPYEFKAGNISFNADKLITLPIRAIQYFDQTKFTKTMMACTIVNAVRQWFHRVGKTFTNEEMFKIVDYCVTQWYQIGDGWSTVQAMTAVNKYLTLNYPEYKTAFMSFMYNDPELAKIMAKNHAIGMTYKGNSTWDKDRRDWVLDGTVYKPMSYWHRTCIRLITGIDVDDSFSFQFYNIKHFWELVKSGNIYPTVYVWLVDTNLDTENIKKYTKWKIMLEQNIANNNVMLNDPRWWTTDRAFREKLIEDNKVKQAKLDFVTGELKKEWI